MGWADLGIGWVSAQADGKIGKSLSILKSFYKWKTCLNSNQNLKF
jgi:hypothetical protein